ncbi:MAG: hypothetical protein P8L37_05835 [Phycisphaerales bacterium]|nr:hypothetical protein [Phycisphaerales bacterium]
MKYVGKTLGMFVLTLSCMGGAMAQSTDTAPEAAIGESSPKPRSTDQRTNNRLAIELARYATDMLAVPPISVEAIKSSLVFLEEAVHLAPEDIEIAYRSLEVAVLSEQEEAIQSATAHLLSLAPNDQVAQLRLLVMAIDQFQLAAERIRSYEILLQPENRAALGPAISSRLAFQLAMLYRRTGDQDLFGKWIGESMTLDPSFAEAMAVGSGYFQTRVDDPVASVELLVSLLMADLTDTSTPTVLANALMQHGAYESADRMYTLSAADLIVSEQAPSNNLLADLAMAQWATGKGEEALTSIQARQLEMNKMYRSMTGSQNPGMSPLDLALLEAPLTPTLATVRAVIASDSESDAAADALAAAEESYLNAIKILENSPNDSSKERAAAKLELAWLQLWLGADAEHAAVQVASANELSQLSELAQARFDGWILFRQGHLQDATSTLEPLVERDTSASLGLAMILEEQGHLQDAAERYLSIARDSTGTLVGIWSKHRLEDLLGAPLPPSETAAAMTALVNTIPRGVDRYPADPSRAVSFTIAPVSENIQAYDPVQIEVEISNNTSMPMAISPEGPLRKLLLLQSDLRVTGSKPIRYGPVIYDIGKRLRLGPYESYSFQVDMRMTWVGRVLNLFPLEGSSLIIRGISNFIAGNNTSSKNTVFTPGLLGSEATCEPIRIDGIRVDDDWAAGVILSVQSAQITADQLTNMALLAAVIANDSQDRINATLSEEVREHSIEAIIAAFHRCDDIQQAWFLSVVKPTERFRSLSEDGLADGNRLITMITLIRLLEIGDPLQVLENGLLISSLRSSDQTVKALAEWIERRTQQMLEDELNREQGDAPAPSGP